jgi:hypothetical protein
MKLATMRSDSKKPKPSQLRLPKLLRGVVCLWLQSIGYRVPQAYLHQKLRDFGKHFPFLFRDVMFDRLHQLLKLRRKIMTFGSQFF